MQIPSDLGSGGAYLANGGAGQPTLASILRLLAIQTPETVTGIAVTTNAATLSDAGQVLNVQSTTGSTTGPMTPIVTGAPTTGQVLVEYDTDGVATLTFAAADAVTEAAVQKLPAPTA